MHSISCALLDWYDHHHRHLPWRITPQQKSNGVKADPYHVWLSEIMLQQTTVEAVKAYYKKFIHRWPNIFALAQASQDDVMKNWAGLGYYSRARNLKACSGQIIATYDGIFPQSFAKLRALKGIGDYTAAAICAIAYDQSVAVVDSNVERVISRLFAIQTPLPKAKPEIKDKTQQLTPEDRPGDFAQAMMDLGSAICTPKRPRCPTCPLNHNCKASQQLDPAHFPIKAAKKPRPTRKGDAFIALSRHQRIYLEKRSDKGLLGGMSQVPNYFSQQQHDSNKSICPPFDCQWQFCGVTTHIFTHFSLQLNVYRADHLLEKEHQKNGWWCSRDQLDKEALPTVMKKAINVALPGIFPQKTKPKTR